jgi:hypothetical protein
MNQNESEMTPEMIEPTRQSILELLRLVAREVVRKLKAAAESTEDQNDDVADLTKAITQGPCCPPKT